MRREHAKDLIKDALRYAAKDRIEEAFIQSQLKCPVRTGFLKNSGKLNEVDNGFYIRYSAEYSSFVERGLRGGWQYVQPYYHKDGSFVNAHNRYMPRREGVHLIESSMKNSFSKLNSIIDNMLKTRFHGKVTR